MHLQPVTTSKGHAHYYSGAGLQCKIALVWDWSTGHTSVVCLHIDVMLFCHFHSCSGPNDPNDLCILSHTGLYVTTGTSALCLIGLHPTKTPLEGGNYYEDKLLFVIVYALQ